MAQTAKQFWDAIPFGVKLGGAAVITLVAYSKIKNASALNKALREAKIQAELEKLYGSAGLPGPAGLPGGALSYPLAQYKTWADTLHSYMDGAGTSSEEEFLTVFDKLKTNGDFNQLVKAFGSRWIASGLPWPANGGYYTLPAGIRSEWDIDTINRFNGVLDASGITLSL